MEAPPSSLSSRAQPDFLQAAPERAACAVFCKENRMELPTSPTSTGNPGQPRDLQFRGPFLNDSFRSSEFFLTHWGETEARTFRPVKRLYQ